MLGAVLGGEGSEEEEVEEEEDEPDGEAEEEVALSSAAVVTSLFKSPTFLTSVSSRPACLTQYQVTSAMTCQTNHELIRYQVVILPFSLIMFYCKLNNTYPSFR